ncbi:TPA: helix-turn-helix domain-containing protein [Pseudomonas aeruginosa]|nr:helix-turn-helix domain-containing protein [Pseudomonas aeruginosa]
MAADRRPERDVCRRCAAIQARCKPGRDGCCLRPCCNRSVFGNSVRVVPIHAELTTQEAADLLNVSRPHLVKLLEEGDLPHHKTGRHRRVCFSDLMEYKQQRDAVSHKVMDELANLSEEVGLGY